jgi:hypothetical protein
MSESKSTRTQKVELAVSDIGDSEGHGEDAARMICLEQLQPGEVITHMEPPMRGEGVWIFSFEITG